MVFFILLEMRRIEIMFKFCLKYFSNSIASQ